MRNILTSTPSESELATILAETAGQPALPPLGDVAWAVARANPAVAAWFVPVAARADADAVEPLPELSDELYADFSKTGDRLPFERPYFERRRRLGRAAMVVLLGDDAARVRILPSFLSKLEAILAEESWSLPAHVWTEPGGKNPWMIDLFAAETANNLAEILAVLAAVIPADLARRIRTRLRVHVFENYVAPRTSFHWLTISNNWNAVCHQGVLGAALAVEEDHALVARMLSLAAARLPMFLEGFGADGSTSEGPGYWSYGFGWFCELNAQLEHRTAGRLSILEGDAKIAAIARFAPLMTLSNGHMVNFSDGGRTGRLGAPLLSYLGRRLDDANLAAQGAFLYRAQTEAGLSIDEARRDFFNMTRIALRTPPIETIRSAREPIQPDAWFPDYGAIVARGTDSFGRFWEFAAKGGHNDEHHNHNDCGSFLLNLDGTPALIEIGAPEYVRAFFSDARYTFLAARSLGHSVPLVNGWEQSAGRVFSAEVLKAEIGDDRVEFVVDLTKCYPPEARCEKLHRAFVFEKSAGRLSITDTCVLSVPGTVECMLICPPHAELDGGRGRIAGPSFELLIEPATGSCFVSVETCEYRDHKGEPAEVRRLRLAAIEDMATTHVIGAVFRIG